VATFSYLPYAVFNFASPLLAIAMAYFGIRMFRTDGKAVAAPPAEPGSASVDRD
jgi:Na+/H+ antiporter NhaC